MSFKFFIFILWLLFVFALSSILVYISYLLSYSINITEYIIFIYIFVVILFLIKWSRKKV